MRNVFTIFCLAVCTLLLMSCGADQAMKKGDKFYALGEYYDASVQYRKAYSKVPNKDRAEKGRRALKLADCYRRIHFTSKAITAYQNAVRYKQDDSLTHFYLGQLQMRNGNYREAEKQFQMAIDSLQFTVNTNYLALAKNGLKAAQMAPQWKKDGSAYTVKRMDFFNSRRSEFSPMLGGDNGEQLYFTSTRNQAQGDEYSGITGSKNADIFFSQKDDKEKWGKPQTIDSELNTEHDEGVCCLTPDGKAMFLTLCKTDPNYPRYATIVVSNRSDAAWSKPSCRKTPCRVMPILPYRPTDNGFTLSATCPEASGDWTSGDADCSATAKWAAWRTWGSLSTRRVTRCFQPSDPTATSTSPATDTPDSAAWTYL